MSGATMTARRDRPATTADAPVLRRTRRRLIAWSAGSTFVVLVVLGVAIYAAAASSLAATGEAQLEARAVEMTDVAFRAQLAGPGERMLTVTNDPSQPGVVIGGATSGTIGSSSTSSWPLRCRSGAASRCGARGSSRRSSRISSRWRRSPRDGR
jgi:hypothetical protein